MSLGTTSLVSAVDPLEILLECESKCLCAKDAKASFGGRGAGPAGRDVHKLTSTGILPPPGEEHAPLCPPHLLPEAASLFQGSKDMLKQMSLKAIKSLFHQATSGTKDESQAYMKTMGST